jgi:hypothetical protein
VRVDRPLDPAERFFWLADRVSCMNFVVFAELDGGVDASRLRAALDRAQQAHPLLRVRIAIEPGAPRFESDDRVRIPLQVESIAEHGRVRSISFALCPMPFQLAFCAVSTFAGRRLLNLTYDAAKLPTHDAAQMTAGLRDRLAAQAGG